MPLQRTNYRKCTKSQVTFDPADGENVFNGVITVNLNMDLRSLDFISASTRAIEILSDYNINYTHRSFIMPNTGEKDGIDEYERSETFCDKTITIFFIKNSGF